MFVFENGPLSSSLDKTLLFCPILVLQSTGDQTCTQGPSDVDAFLKNTGHSPLSCTSAGCLKTFRWGNAQPPKVKIEEAGENPTRRSDGVKIQLDAG